jgi:hypothetical protein
MVNTSSAKRIITHCNKVIGRYSPIVFVSACEIRRAKKTSHISSMENSAHAERPLRTLAVARDTPVRDAIIPAGSSSSGRNRVMKTKATACQPTEKS